MQESISLSYVKNVIATSKQFKNLVNVKIGRSSDPETLEAIVVRTNKQGLDDKKQDPKTAKVKFSVGVTNITFALDYLRLNLPNLIVAVSFNIIYYREHDMYHILTCKKCKNEYLAHFHEYFTLVTAIVYMS